MPKYLDVNDDDLPVASKPSSQQYDPYSIYDMHCVDIKLQAVSSIETVDKISKKTDGLAVQVYSVGIIECDFNSIVNTYR